MHRLYANIMPFYIRDWIILVFWDPSGDLEPILCAYRGTTVPAPRVCQGQGYEALAGILLSLNEAYF